MVKDQETGRAYEKKTEKKNRKATEIQDSRFKIQDPRFQIQDLRFKIQDSRFKIQDLPLGFQYFDIQILLKIIRQ